MRERVLRPLLAAAIVGGASLPAAAQTNFGTYVSVGDSLAAGFQSGSLVETHQRRSAPAHIARLGNASDFQMPLVSEPGIPPENVLVSLLPSTVIAPKSGTNGSPLNFSLGRPYNNLAIPGTTAVDAITKVTDGGGLHDLILRGRGTQIQQAVSLRPTFVTLWLGNNDVLGAVTRGTAIPGVTLTPVDVFRTTYASIVSQLKGTGAFVVSANIPEVTSIPFVTTLKPYLTNALTGQPILANGARIPLIGPNGPLPETSFVTLAASNSLAQGIGVPTAVGGRGTPLPDAVILDASEIQIINAHLASDNQAIREICQQNGIPLVDLNQAFRDYQACASGTPGATKCIVGGVRLTPSFITGGLFGYDGIHPSDTGYALVANEWIRTINAAGGSLSEVDVTPYLNVRTSARDAAVPEFSDETWQNLLAVFPEIGAR